MSYVHVKCPEYAKYDAINVLQSLQCKLCGAVIADTADRIVRYEMSRGGERIKVIKRQFTRLSNYREIKIAFDDPLYFHVTHGCSGCMGMSLPADVLAEMHRADQEHSPDGYTDRERSKTPTHVVAVSTGGII